MSRVVTSLLLPLLLAACSGVDDSVVESAETVLTLQSGTINELRQKRGTGPYKTYPYPPDEMLTILETAARKARNDIGEPVQAVFVYELAREVVAKERSGKDGRDTAYEDPWRTAMYAAVLPARGDPKSSRVEIHAMQRGPFHKGVVQWQRDMPGWIDEVIAEREAPVMALPR